MIAGRRVQDESLNEVVFAVKSDIGKRAVGSLELSVPKGEVAEVAVFGAAARKPAVARIRIGYSFGQLMRNDRYGGIDTGIVVRAGGLNRAAIQAAIRVSNKGPANVTDTGVRGRMEPAVRPTESRALRYVG